LSLAIRSPRFRTPRALELPRRMRRLLSRVIAGVRNQGSGVSCQWSEPINLGDLAAFHKWFATVGLSTKRPRR
jgi:hypothetical protein